MAFQKEVYKARPKRTADGAVNARYTHAKKKEDGEKPAKTSAKAAVREKATPAKAASSAGKTAEKNAAAGCAAGKQAAARRDAGKKTVYRKVEEKKAAEKKTEKKTTEKKITEKKPAEKKTAQRRAVVKEPPKKAVSRRESGKERRARERQDAVYRDRRRAVRRSADMKTVLIVLMTVVFEVFGLLLAAVRVPGSIDWQALTLLAAMAPLCMATSLILPRWLPLDALIMALTNFLCGVGVVILYTVSPERGAKQTAYYALGLAAMIIMSLIFSRKRRFKGMTVFAMLAGVGALILPLAFGQWSGGAKNWVQLPFIGSFQPSELVKLSLVLAMAYYFSAHRTVFQMMPAILFAAACLLLLMLQRDLGTALIYYAATLVMFYVACGNLPLTVIGLGGGMGAAMLGYRMFAHVKVRVAMWRNPWSDPLDKGYQIIQALLAIGSGGLFGVGLGQGTPEKIPAYFNDFIFAVICEQMGLVFGLLVLAVYLLLILRGVSVISRSRRSFDMLLGCGVLAILAIQTFMIVGGVIKMLPLTGVTMPFLSYGDSSLLSCLMMVGILHGVSARAQQDLEDDILGIQE